MNTSTHNSKRHQSGLSLIELMVAMSLGLTLVASAVTVFSSSRKSVDLNSALTEMQDNARFAMDSITRDLRMAGFQGCVDINTSAARILANNAPTSDYFETAVGSALIEASETWVPEVPAGFNIPNGVGKPVPGTHALVAQFGNPETYTIEPMQTVDADIVLNSENSGLTQGDLALISNCQVADIFEITSAAGASLQHSSTANSDQRLSAPYGVSGANNLTRIMRFESNIYYIGDTMRTNGAGDPVYSLYKQTIPYELTNPPIEMIEGVSNFKIRLGFRESDDDADEGLTYVRPEDAASVEGHAEVVQLGLLMESYDPILDANDTSTYVLAGVMLSPGGAPADSMNSYISDKRLKLAFNSTVKIRNRR